ncbi:MAG: DUF4212 domain-containing protein [Rhodocyclaceae bacterium]
MSAYWQRNRVITVLLLGVWASATLVVAIFAPDFNRHSFLGFPLGFYFAAQGVLVLYLVIVGLYAWYMNRFDRQQRRQQRADTAAGK